MVPIVSWTDPLRSVIRNRSTRAGSGVADRIVFLGAYTQALAPDIYRSAHAYIATTHMDACPNSVIEALACGLPVAYSASGGVPELVGPDAGVGVEVREDFSVTQIPDIAQFGEAMIEVSERHGHMTKAARARAVEAFDLRVWIERHEQIFRSHLETRR